MYKGHKPSKKSVVSQSDNASPTVRSKATLAGSQVYSSNASSSRMLIKVSGSTISGHGGHNANVAVLDDDGNDVTPLPLISPNISKPPRGGGGGSHAASGSEIGIGKESVADVLNTLESMAFGGSWNTSIWKGGVSYSNSSRASGTSTPEEKDDDSASMTSADSDNNEGENSESQKNTRQENQTHSPKAHTGSKVGVVELDLNKPIHLMLEETDTLCLIDIPSVCVSNDNLEEVIIVKAANAKYKELKGNRANNDNLVDRAMQTFNYASKNKEVQATALKCANAESMVNQWSIYDAYVTKDTTTDIGEGVENSGKDMEMDALPGLELGSGGPDAASASAIGDSSMLNMVGVGGSDFSSGTVGPHGAYATDEAASDTTHSSVAQGNEGSLAPPSGLAASSHMMEGGPDKSAYEKELALSSLNQESLKTTLLITERAVVGNNYMKKLVAYRNLPDVPAEEEAAAAAAAAAAANHENMQHVDSHDDELSNPDENDGDVDGDEETDHRVAEANRAVDQFATNIPSMQFLWSFRCELTRGRTVMYMSWNKQNEDILAIAYGECKTSSNVSPGLVLCWSLKNPEWPERVYKAQSPVSAIDFSKTTPNLLAVGYMDGRISIYDVRKNDPKPVLDNSSLVGKHRETVWELKWVERERVHGDEQSRGETLVSISTDGRVTQWIIRKGLEFTDLMTLKRVNKQEAKAGSGAQGVNNNPTKTGAFISRLAGGLCFDFNPNDSNMYIVGTDDGHLHRCSCSLYEQYLATHFGHTGPIYRVRWSPFLPGAFLSCSADWTVRLWHQDTEEAVFKFQSGKDNISDIAWSPASSTVFGSVSTDGRMEIWDLQFSVLDPVILHSVLDRQLTCIIFASKTPVVLIGDDNGAVNVYKLQQMPSLLAATNEDQASLLATVIAKNNQGAQTNQNLQTAGNSAPTAPVAA